MNLEFEKNGGKVAASSAAPADGDEAPALVQLKGHVDGFEGGILRGWAQAVDDPSARVRLEVRCGSSVVGSGVADVFRSDLRSAGIGDGRHGFEIALSDELRAHAGETLVLVHEDGRIVETNSFVVPAPGPRAWVDMAAEPGAVLRILVSLPDLVDGTYTVDVLEGLERVASLGVEFRGGVATSRIAVPVRLVDGEIRRIRLALHGHPHALGEADLVFPTVHTPWEHLRNGSEAVGVASLARSAARRYESLRAQLRAIADGTSSLTVDQLDRLHGLVVEGWQGRTEFPEICLPRVENPDVTILVPAHNKLELTYHACAAIGLAHNRASYEVVVIDDASTDRTAEIERIVENLVVVRNEPNKGFLRSVNKGASEARGRYLVILNNDTEVTTGWLDELLAPFADEKVGLVGSKLLNLDGSIQEAGGIVWGNGQPWNVGRNSNPLDPDYGYTREVDYVSGAAMCIRRDLWERLGGFSDELAPAYYEDTDLAFKVRQAGYRVVYASLSEVIHFEGQSNGRDVTQGIKRYQIVNESKFREKWFEAYHGHGRVGQDLHLLKDRYVDHRVLVVDACSPDPQRDAGGYAAIQEMKLFQALGFKVTFAPRDMAHMGKVTWNLQRMGIEALYAPFYQSVPEVLARRGSEFDVVYITRFEVAESVLEQVRQTTSAKVIFNNADLHFLRMLRSYQVSGEPSLEEILVVRERELAMMRDVDAIVSYNELEHAVILSHNLRDDNVFKCPWVVGPRDPGPGFEERRGIAFLGGYRHPPNVEGVLYFVKDVMPALLEREPDVKLYIYGSHAPDVIRELESDHVEVVGYVESLDEVFHRHRVFVAPLLSGAGLKGKVVETMAYGLPPVLTRIAAEATGLSDGTNAFVADTVDEWVEGISTFLNDRVAWESARASLMKLARRQFDQRNALDQWRKVLASVGLFTRTRRSPARTE